MKTTFIIGNLFFQKITSILSIIILSLISFNVNAQLLNEGFEGATFPPANWIRANQFGNTASGSWSAASATPPNSANAVVFGSSGNPTNLMHEKFLITPQLTPNANNNVLSFKLRRAASVPLFGKISVRVSTNATQNLLANYTELVNYTESSSSLSSTLGVFTTLTLNLSAYNNQNIYIAFVWVGNGDGGFYLDDVQNIPLATASGPAINITSNANNINNGSTTTATTNNTNFGIVNINSNAVVKTFTIQSTGTTALNLTGNPLVSITGAGASSFSVTQNPTATINNGGSSTFDVTMATNVGGVKNATLTIANNSNNAPSYTFAIQGNINVPSPFITMTGNNTNIANGATTINTNNNTDFGVSIVNGTAIEKTFTITNDGDATLNLTGTPAISITGTNASNFSVTQVPALTTIPMTNNTTYKITFNPSSVGAKTAVVSIANNSAANPFTFTIGGNVVQPQINLKGNTQNIPNGNTAISTNNNTDFGSLQINLTQTKTFVIESTGLVNLTLTGTPFVTLSGTNASEFSITQQPTSPITNGQNSSFVVSFNPTSVGSKNAIITIANNSGNASTYTFAVGGNATPIPAPVINVQGNGANIVSGSTSVSSNNNTDFGTINNMPPSSIMKTFVIQNIGNANLTLSGNPIVSISGTDAANFSVTQQATSPITPSLSSSFSITFTTTTPGIKNAIVTIANNSSVGSYTFAIRGTGDPILSFENQLSNGKVNIYPNPAKNDFNIALEGINADNIGVEMIDLQGKKIINNSFILENNKTNVGTNNINSGLYILKLKIGKEIITRKIIIK
ncbi:MAG: choice-of-anchor D domain-containing protein [Bacteroidetes bacterium]|nr:MAG: choice-of-anchor D domain-containing protein [Bacteroidota bacterium]